MSYYPNGLQKLKGEYKDNMKVGEWVENFSNGLTKDIITYKLLKEKTKMDYALFKGRVTYESKKHGHAESYSAKDYKKTEEGAYKEGEKDGEWIAYHPGGKNPAVITNYKAGILHGRMKQFSKRGKLMQEMDYKNGLKHGKFIVYDKRGRVIKEMNYEYGQRVIEGTNTGSGGFTPGR